MKEKTIKHLGYCCIGPTITPKKIDGLKKSLKNDKKFVKAKHYYSILTGKTRLDILYLLNKEGELCVCDMADILETTVSAISHQLKILRKADFVKTRKDAQTIFYYLTSKIRQELKNNF